MTIFCASSERYSPTSPAPTSLTSRSSPSSCLLEPAAAMPAKMILPRGLPSALGSRRARAVPGARRRAPARPARVAWGRAGGAGHQAREDGARRADDGAADDEDVVL